MTPIKFNQIWKFSELLNNVGHSTESVKILIGRINFLWKFVRVKLSKQADKQDLLYFYLSRIILIIFRRNLKDSKQQTTTKSTKAESFWGKKSIKFSLKSKHFNLLVYLKVK